MGVAVCIGVSVAKTEVSVGAAIEIDVSVGGGRVAVSGTGVLVADGLVPQPLSVKARRDTTESNGESFFIPFLLQPFSNTSRS
jgi:predicted metal-dependent phosphoesterase TrpH